MYKTVNGKIAVNIPEYIVGPNRVTRSYHSSKFINISILASFLLDQPSVDAFKSAVTNYFSFSHWHDLSLSSTIYLIFSHI